MNCHACQQALPAEAKFCFMCGQAQLRRCASCGDVLLPETRLCRTCGYVQPSQAPTPAAAPKLETTGDRRVVTVLFADVSGFTAMSEKLDPEEVTGIVNQFFEVLTEPIYRYGGVVDKYIGDAIMALFGAPVAHEDDPERAVHAAFEMQRAAKEFSEQLKRRTGIGLKVRIGLHTGLVVAGAVGGEQKRDYTVMGDTVNLAQRMEATARPGRILVTHETYRLTAHAMEYLSLDPLVIKGKVEPVLVYELVGPLVERPVQTATRRLFGRKHELETLQDKLRRSTEGVPQLVFLVGDAGLGKSELSSALFAGLARELGVEGQRVRALSYEQDAPFALVRDFVRRWLGVAEVADASVIEAALTKRGSLGPEERARAARAIGYMLGLESESAEFEQLSPQQRRTMALHALNAAVLTAAQKRPVLLNFEDMHWSDEASLEWLQSLLDAMGTREFQTAKVTILCQARPPECDAFAHWRSPIDTTTLRLQPFNETESLSYVGSLLELDQDVSTWDQPLRQVIDQVLSRAEGNPLFLREMVHALIETGALVHTVDLHWEVVGALDSKLPSTINGVVLSRLDRLSAGLRSLLQVASLFGRSFHADLVASVAEFPQSREGLEALAKAGFIQRRSNGEWQFQQELIREVAYSSLLLASRRDLHRKAGLALEVHLGARAKESPQVLARHFQQGEHTAKAIYYLYKSGKMALASFANQEALHCFEDCLKLFAKGEDAPSTPTPVDVHLAIAELQATMGQYAAAIEHLQAALAQQSEPHERAETLRRMGGVANVQGQYQEAMAFFDEGLASLGPDGDDTTLARILLDQGLTLFRQGQFAEVAELCRRSMDVLEGTSCTKELAMAQSIMGIVSYRQGQLKEAEAYHQRAYELREQIQDTFGVASSLNNLGVLYLDLGDWQKATDYYDRSLKIYQQIGDVSRQIIQLNNLGDLLRNQGELEEAEFLHHLALELSQQSHDTLGAGIAAAGVGMALLAGDRNDEAIPYLQQGIERLQEINAVEILPEPLAMITKAYTAELRYDEAQAALDRSLSLARANESRAQLGMALCAQAHLLEQRGDYVGACQAIDMAVAELGTEAPPIDRARALTIAARLYRRLDRTHEAEQFSAEAADIFNRLGAKNDLFTLKSPINAP